MEAAERTCPPDPGLDTEGPAWAWAWAWLRFLTAGKPDPKLCFKSSPCVNIKPVFLNLIIYQDKYSITV